MSGNRLTYRFGPLERRGLLGPVRVGQAAWLALGALLAIGSLNASPNATGALLALLLFGLFVALAVVPIRERTLEEWGRTLRERGVEIELERDWERGGRSIYVRDPAGNSVELVEGDIWPE